MSNEEAALIRVMHSVAVLTHKLVPIIGTDAAGQTLELLEEAETLLKDNSL